ncbi:carbohydate-binding domain-containing protein [Pseudoalteromonas sp. C2R02]|uniref:family 20 glycosylhydrolase n=1 Tax=Pseudoalteromonas sp. C2R02 TaxID=2841565 RepID=UPI001C087747|nr:family 20 glycosylhydrolase [Pseudoalteromonas sp. C2R02]MBU2972387.1 carbohydate-binding domain-containing protein [Pseudoalteromonas sp. C2R02]
MRFNKSMLCGISASLICSIPMFAIAGVSQDSVEKFTQKTQLKFGVSDNFKYASNSFEGNLNFDNKSDVDLPAGISDWQVYFHSIRKIAEQVDKGLKFEHVNGDLHRLVPTSDFKGLKSGSTLELTFKGAAWIAAYSDFMPRAFMVANNGAPVIFSNTDTEDFSQFVKPIVRENQIKKFNSPEMDLTQIANAENRYIHNTKVAKNDISESDALKRVIPMPQDVDFNRGETVLNDNWQIRYSGGATSEIKVFLADLKKYYKLELQAEPNHIPTSKQPLINIVIDDSVNKGKAASYQLEVDDNKIEIIGSDNAGVFYGMQTLLALAPADSKKEVTLPRVEIADSPRYEWRGMHYDNARNYHGKEAMFKLVEQMGRYKLNKLHWHFSDDEGWRLEIPDLPELTEIGAHRCFDLKEQTCLLTQLGTGPFKSGSGNGFMTRADFVELLKFAAARHIQIIPEVESPGHARAAIKSMEARYNKLIAKDKKQSVGQLLNQAGVLKTDTEVKTIQNLQAKAYLLSDPADTSFYNTVQNYKDNSVNVCMDSSYQFIDKVTYELQQMYREAGVRLTNLHFGGDEVGKGSWTGSPVCQALFDKPGNGVSGVADLKPYFTKRVAELLNARGISPGAWEDGLMYDTLNTFNRKELPNEVFTANVWDNIWEWGVADRAYRLANNDYQVVLSHGTHLYFDHPYEAHPEERGYYWAGRYTSTEKTFGYMPDNVYANADFTRSGKVIDNLEALVGRSLPKLEKPENILGMQGQVWSESIRTEDQVLKMLFPRVLAVAERAWHKAPWEGDNPSNAKRQQDWLKFSAALGKKELNKMLLSGVSPYLPVPGGVIENGKLKANSSVPYLKIEVSLDNGSNWQPYLAPIKVTKDQKVKLRSYLNENSKSRITQVN